MENFPNDFPEEVYSEEETKKELEKQEEENQNEANDQEQMAREVFETETNNDAEFFKKKLEPEEFRTWQKKIKKDFLTLPPEKRDLTFKTLGEMLKEVNNELNKSPNDSNLIAKRVAIINRLQTYHSALEEDEKLETRKEKPQQTSKTKTAEIKPDELTPENVEEVIKEKLNIEEQESQAPEPQKASPTSPEKQPDKSSIKNQLFNLLGNAEKILESKGIEPQEKVDLLKEYGEQIAKLLGVPTTEIYLSELIKDNKKVEALLNKVSNLKKEEPPPPEDVQKAKEFIKKEEKKGKESAFSKIGGWKTIGGIAGFSLFMFLILIFLGEFKLLEKATGIDLEGGGGKKK